MMVIVKRRAFGKYLKEFCLSYYFTYFFAQPVFRPAFNLSVIVEVACCLKKKKGEEFEPPRAPNRGLKQFVQDAVK